MKEEIETAIKSLTKKAAKDGVGSADALRFSQAALNLANATRTLGLEV